MGTININNLQNPISIADLQSPATNGVDEVKENKVTAPETEQISKEATSVKQDAEKVLISGGSQIEQKGQVFAASHEITAAKKPDDSWKLDDSWVKVEDNAEKLKYNDLDRLTHGKYNLGQLKLDENGKFDIINNHKFRILRNFSKTTPAENRAVREAVVDALKTRFRFQDLENSLNRADAKKFTQLINSFTAAENSEKTLSRAEVGALIDQCEKFEKSQQDADCLFKAMTTFFKAIPDLKDKQIGLDANGKVLIENRLPSAEENRILRTAIGDWLQNTFTDHVNFDPKRCPMVVMAKAFLKNAENISQEVKFNDVIDLAKGIEDWWTTPVVITPNYVVEQKKIWDKVIKNFLSNFTLKKFNEVDIRLAKEIILKGEDALIQQGVKEKDIADQKKLVDNLKGFALVQVQYVKYFYTGLSKMPEKDRQEVLSLLRKVKDFENDNTVEGKKQYEKLRERIDEICRGFVCKDNNVAENFDRGLKNFFFNTRNFVEKFSKRLAFVESLKDDFEQVTSDLDDKWNVVLDKNGWNVCKIETHIKLAKEFLATHPSALDGLKTDKAPTVKGRIAGYEKDLANEISWKELTNRDIEALKSKIKAMETNPQSEVQVGGGAKQIGVQARDYVQIKRDINHAINFLDNLNPFQDLSTLKYEGENKVIKDVIERLQTGYREEDDNGDADNELTLAALKRGLQVELEHAEDILELEPVVNAPKQETVKTLDDLRLELAEKEKLVELHDKTIKSVQDKLNVLRNEYVSLEAQSEYLTMFNEDDVEFNWL